MNFRFLPSKSITYSSKGWWSCKQSDFKTTSWFNRATSNAPKWWTFCKTWYFLQRKYIFSDGKTKIDLILQRCGIPSSIPLTTTSLTWYRVPYTSIHDVLWKKFKFKNSIFHSCFKFYIYVTSFSKKLLKRKPNFYFSTSSSDKQNLTYVLHN